MPLREFHCSHCNYRFEQITKVLEQDPDLGKCPKCQRKSDPIAFSSFRVGGQGDLRENTIHGCHDHDGAGHHHAKKD